MTARRRCVLVAWLSACGGLGAASCGRSDLYPARGARPAPAGTGGAAAPDAGRKDAAPAPDDARADARDSADAGSVADAGGGDRDAADGPCGPLIDDIENGSGRICQGPEGRLGVWYAFNSDAGTQWPVPTTPGVPIETSAIPGGRLDSDSRRAMHTYGTAFGAWGAGIGFDLAFDGSTYRLYDAGAYSGVMFWARGKPQGPPIDFRISTAGTTVVAYGGVCPLEPCRPVSVPIPLNDDWTQYWVPFAELHGLERNKVTNMQFLAGSGAPFDFWVDDVSFFVGAAPCCPADCPGTVPIIDSVLDSAVRGAAGVDGDRPLGCGDVCGVSSLSTQGKVQSASGMQCLRSLATLTLAQGLIADIGPLGSLGRLITLDLQQNQIADVGPLATLPRLITLDLHQNQIADLGPLATLPRLTGLNLRQNQIADISPLSGLDSLRTLALADNQVTAVVPPFALPSLTDIDLSRNRVTDVRGLAGAGHLQSVALPDNRMVALGSLAGLDKLAQLDLSRNQIVSLATLPVLPSLSALALPENQIVDLTGLSAAPALTSLDLSSNQLADIGPLAGLASLESLGAARNRIVDLSPLVGLRALASLSIAQNQVVDLAPLAGKAATLVSVDLSQNRIVDLSPLSGPGGALWLDASGNQLQRIDGLRARTFLSLDLSQNTLVDAGLADDVTFLPTSDGRSTVPAWLDLSSNQLRDLARLASSAGLIAYMAINLRDNPIDCAAQAENLKTLRARVNFIDSDCF